MKQSNQQTVGSSAVPGDLEKASLDTVYATLSTSAQGLSSAEAKSRLHKCGRDAPNQKRASATARMVPKNPGLCMLLLMLLLCFVVLPIHAESYGPMISGILSSVCISKPMSHATRPCSLY